MSNTYDVRTKKVIEVPVPDGMTSSEFDQKVIDVAKSFGNVKGIGYLEVPLFFDTKGNCNSSTSTILIKAGVSKKEVYKIEKRLPATTAGFSAHPKPWTKEEQQKAVNN